MRVIRIAVVVLLAGQAARAEEAAVRGYEGQARKVIERALTRYRGLQSYQDTLTARLDITVETPEQLKLPEAQEIKLAFARPNRIALTCKQFRVISDGRTLWQSFDPIETYTQAPAPARLDLSTLDLSKFSVFEQFRHPVAFVLTGREPSPRDLFGNVVEYTGTTPQARRGRPGQALSGNVEIAMGNAQTARLAFTAWFSDQTGLMEALEYDETRAVQERQPPGAPTVKKYIQHLELTDIVLDQPIPESRFTFTPGKFYEKMATLTLPTGEEFQRRLVGRPAELQARDFQGRPVKLADFKGRVVVLDFWASYCGPCWMVMPYMQKLAEKFANQPVTILGVNGDRPAGAHSDDTPDTAPSATNPSAASAPASQPLSAPYDQLAKALGQREIKYRQVIDPTGKMWEDYRVIGIPHLVMIDKHGIIQLVHSGWTPGEEQQLAADIQALIKGQPLSRPAAQSSSSPNGLPQTR